MKKITGTIFTIMIVAVLVWLGYHLITKENEANSGKAANSAENAATTAPSVTSAPKISEAAEDTPKTLYPAFQYINNERSYGYIDDNGIFVIEPRYNSASDFSEGLAVVYDDKGYHVIDTSGNILFDNDFSIEPFHNGAAVFGKYDGNTVLYGYIDTAGKIILEPKYRKADDFNKNDQAYVSSKENQYERIDKSGVVLETYQLDPKYSMVTGFKDGYIIYVSKEDQKAGVITIKGAEILKPVYSDINYLGEDLFAVKAPDLDSYDLLAAYPSALFNDKGEQLTDYILSDLSPFHEDYASATDSNSTFFIGKDGKEAESLPKYEGRGTLTLLGDTIKADIDNELFYARKDGHVFWHSDHTIELPSGITVKPVKFKPSKYVLVYYPQIEGLKEEEVQAVINSRLMEIFTKSRAGLKESDRISVEDDFNAQLLNNLLIIERTGYDYNFGAAHGMPIRDYYHIDIHTGKFFELKDLFKEGSDYVSKISGIIKKDIEEQSKGENSMFFPETFQSIAKDQYFKITPDALVIYFYPYDIAAYAAGFPEFSIPYHQLIDIIDQSGEFWKSFH